MKINRIIVFCICLHLIASLVGCSEKGTTDNSVHNVTEGVTEEVEVIDDVTSKKVINVVASTWEPYEYEEDGEVKGIGQDVIKEAFERMGYEVKVQFVPFKRALELIELGQADVLTNVNKTAERETFATFCNVSVLTSQTNLFVLKNSRIEYSGDILAMKGYTIGINRGYTHGDIFDQAVKDEFLTVEEAEDTEHNLLKLIDKRIDILMENKLSVQALAKKLGLQNDIKFLEPEYRTANLYTMFSPKSSVIELIDEFDEKLIELREDGTLQKILDSYVN
ncbi:MULTISPECIES: ABC transporter substrate-binding protein [unclassified Fusibacter]|uniref:substrate-binding periplasmic protein n=1 Tax=unclassified Fusibacter TaxID=2624464 RepID=UPI0010120A13|nr:MULTISPECIES: transporter substrate-binding domain-containing protein [unclassified Fusibacter]MCK8060640.1 transporter substrate-binding domain-containing protein [Fusibacter sp. A2]NPE22906.1 amino acid ABC transporter substrate-binding protein [Fusibacter sp. A1]RXV59974.1 hypothetical protein DWB64_13760 [Fusibacter sp. A1]